MRGKTTIWVGYLLAVLCALAALFVAVRGGGYVDRIGIEYQQTFDVESVDRFYNGETGTYDKPLRSNTTLTYEARAQQDDQIFISVVFDVRTQDGDPIFSTERLYEVDSQTQEHRATGGDRGRDGFLFAPRNLHEGQNFTTWHVNYDAPAHMVFQGVEVRDGHPVFHYRSTYEGQVVDQTESLGHLPGVPENRHVQLAVTLDAWYEPETGRLVDYQDDTVAYYIDANTQERIEPWNHFSNTVTDQSAAEQLMIARATLEARNRVALWLPLILAAVAVAVALFSMVTARAEKKKRENKE